VLALGLLVPLYVDEVATKFVQARFFADEGRMVSLFPQCQSGFLQDTPVTWYPAAVLFAAAYGWLPPLFLRLAGMVVLATGLAMVWLWLRQAVVDDRQRLLSLAGIAGLLGAGVLPLTLVLARPEQWLLVCLAGLLALAAGADRLRGARPWAPVALLALFLLLTSLLNYAHPKALFFLPFVLVAAWAVFGAGRPLLLGAAAVFAVLCAFQTYGFAAAVARCEDAPILAGILAAQTTPIGLLAAEPVAFVTAAVGNLLAAPGAIAGHAVFQSAYQSAWLPPVPFAAEPLPVQAVNLGIRAVLYGGLALGLLLPPLAFLATGGRRDLPRNLLLPALWLGLAGHLALYRVWNFYGGALVVTLAAILVAGSLAQLRPGARSARAAGVAVAAALAVLAGSAAVLAVQMAPRLLAAARSADGIPDNQPYSVNAFGYAVERDRLRTLAVACGVPANGSTHLVVDEVSYFAFSGLREPIHLGFISPWGFGADIAGRTRYLLEDLGSEGIIGRCSLVGPEFRNQVLQDGGLCCVDLKDRSYF
jgi:hypothetical protein